MYPESSASLASGWSLGEILGSWNFVAAEFMRKTTVNRYKVNVYIFRIPTAAQRAWRLCVRNVAIGFKMKKKKKKKIIIIIINKQNNN